MKRTATGSISKFYLGSASFKCQVCGRGTRDTGVQSVGNRTCPQCFELAGIENEIQDGYSTVDASRATILAYVAEIVAKGGNVAEWNDTFGLST